MISHWLQNQTHHKRKSALNYHQFINDRKTQKYLVLVISNTKIITCCCGLVAKGAGRKFWFPILPPFELDGSNLEGLLLLPPTWGFERILPVNLFHSPWRLSKLKNKERFQQSRTYRTAGPRWPSSLRTSRSRSIASCTLAPGIVIINCNQCNHRP